MSYLIWLWCRDVFLMLTYAKLLAAVLSSVFSLSLLLCVCVYLHTQPMYECAAISTSSSTVLVLA